MQIKLLKEFEFCITITEDAIAKIGNNAPEALLKLQCEILGTLHILSRDNDPHLSPDSASYYLVEHLKDLKLSMGSICFYGFLETIEHKIFKIFRKKIEKSIKIFKE